MRPTNFIFLKGEIVFFFSSYIIFATKRNTVHPKLSYPCFQNIIKMETKEKKTQIEPIPQIIKNIKKQGRCMLNTQDPNNTGGSLQLL